MALTLATGYWGFREQTPRNYFQIASELGVNYVEVPMYEQVKTASHLSETELWDYRNPQSRKELRESAEDAGVTMVAGTSNIPISPEVHLWNNDASHEFAMATARRAIDISADLGLELLRVAEPAVNAETEAEARDQMASVGHAMSDLGDYAAEHGLKVMVENHGISSQELMWALEAADHSAVGTNFDPHNYLRHGEDPLHAVRNLDSDRVFYCHLKDAIETEHRPSEDVVEDYRYPAPVAVGHGDIDWAPILEELSGEYDGYLTIEPDLTEDVVPSVRRSIDYLLGLEAEHDLGITLA